MKVKQKSHYFKPLSRTIMDYVEHPESKYEGKIGLLGRKHFYADEIIQIGKEANNTEEQPLKKIDVQFVRDKKDICQKILLTRQSDAENAGVDRKTFQRIKERIRKNIIINLKTKAVERLLI